MTRAQEELALPVIAEEVRVTKRTVVAEQVRIRRRAVSEERTIDPPLRRDRIETEHHTVDLVFDAPPRARREGDTLIIPCIEEELVITKRYRVREELHVRTISETKHAPRIIQVRRQELEIERVVVDDSTSDGDAFASSRKTKEG